MAGTSSGLSRNRIGVCYGTKADNLPSPERVISLYKTNNIKKMRLFDPNPDVLEALEGSGIEVMLGVEDGRIIDIASYQENANIWVDQNVKKYRNVNFKYIAVGNEIELHGASELAPYLCQAMERIQHEISEAGLAFQIKVSTPVKQDVLQSTFPPSKSFFKPECRNYLFPIIDFLVKNRSPFLAHIYPYFSYRGDPENIKLDYALFKSPTVVVDYNNGLEYQNLFDASLDAFYWALENADPEKKKDKYTSLKIVVSETGWPSNGGTGCLQKVTNIDNAETYYSKFIEHVNPGNGTPKKSYQKIEAYLFAMFDENEKRGDLTENNFGLFRPNKELKYPRVNFN